MAIHSTDTGVRFTRGRGAAAVSLDVDFSSLERWAARNAVNSSRLMSRSFGRACAGLKRQLQKIMKVGGGLNGVPKFRDYEEFTKSLRIARGKDPSGPIGGYFAEPGSIVAYKKNGWQVVGWPDSAEASVVAFQDGAGGGWAERFLTDTKSRAQLHRLLRTDYIPRGYVHNRRQILEPYFADHIRKHLDEWAKTNYYKELARQMQKAGGVSI